MTGSAETDTLMDELTLRRPYLAHISEDDKGYTLLFLTLEVYGIFAETRRNY